jgi:uncharacterized protein with PIN domain
MYNPTRWGRFKDIVRCILCRHKHIEVRTVSGGSEGEEMKILGRFTYCLDCENNLGEPTAKELETSL